MKSRIRNRSSRTSPTRVERPGLLFDPTVGQVTARHGNFRHMGPRIARGALVLSLLGSGHALAVRPPQQFQPPPELSAEDVAAQKSRQRDNIAGYDKAQEVPPEPFPWMAVGLAGLTLLVAAPFGLRYYASVSSEINASKNGNRRGRVTPESNGFDGR
jgi:hypothetical protein